MGKIITVNRLDSVVKDLNNQGKKIVAAGGCFDILHPGHVTFLEKAKQAGDVLIVLLEADKKVQQLKGFNRPYHTQKMRAKVLSALSIVDFCLMLPFMESEESYNKLVQKIHPDVIAVTKGYQGVDHQKRTAKLSGARLEYVTKMLGNHSTSRILDKK